MKRQAGRRDVFVLGLLMPTTKERLEVLGRELEFLENGGYRSPILWRVPLIFEDSPICLKDRWSVCPRGACALLDSVPQGSRHETVPCRHIPLNDTGETVHSLYITGTNEEIQEALRAWLLKTITCLEQEAESEATEATERTRSLPERTQKDG